LKGGAGENDKIVWRPANNNQMVANNEHLHYDSAGIKNPLYRAYGNSTDEDNGPLTIINEDHRLYANGYTTNSGGPEYNIFDSAQNAKDILNFYQDHSILQIQGQKVVFSNGGVEQSLPLPLPLSETSVVQGTELAASKINDQEKVGLHNGSTMPDLETVEEWINKTENTLLEINGKIYSFENNNFSETPPDFNTITVELDFIINHITRIINENVSNEKIKKLNDLDEYSKSLIDRIQKLDNSNKSGSTSPTIDSSQWNHLPFSGLTKKEQLATSSSSAPAPDPGADPNPNPAQVLAADPDPAQVLAPDPGPSRSPSPNPGADPNPNPAPGPSRSPSPNPGAGPNPNPGQVIDPGQVSQLAIPQDLSISINDVNAKINKEKETLPSAEEIKNIWEKFGEVYATFDTDYDLLLQDTVNATEMFVNDYSKPHINYDTSSYEDYIDKKNNEISMLITAFTINHAGINTQTIDPKYTSYTKKIIQDAIEKHYKPNLEKKIKQNMNRINHIKKRIDLIQSRAELTPIIDIGDITEKMQKFVQLLKLIKEYKSTTDKSVSISKPDAHSYKEGIKVLTDELAEYKFIYPKQDCDTILEHQLCVPVTYRGKVINENSKRVKDTVDIQILSSSLPHDGVNGTEIIEKKSDGKKHIGTPIRTIPISDIVFDDEKQINEYGDYSKVHDIYRKIIQHYIALNKNKIDVFKKLLKEAKDLKNNFESVYNQVAYSIVANGTSVPLEDTIADGYTHLKTLLDMKEHDDKKFTTIIPKGTIVTYTVFEEQRRNYNAEKDCVKYISKLPTEVTIKDIKGNKQTRKNEWQYYPFRDLLKNIIKSDGTPIEAVQENLKNIDNVRVGFGIWNKTDSIITKFQTFLADIKIIYNNDADLQDVIDNIAKTLGTDTDTDQSMFGKKLRDQVAIKMNIIIDYKDFLVKLEELIIKNNPNEQTADITQDDYYNLNNNNNENAVSTETEFEMLRSKLYDYFKKNPDTLKIDMFNNQKRTFSFSSNGLELYKNYFNKIVATNNKKSLAHFMKGLNDDLEKLEAEEDDLSDNDYNVSTDDNVSTTTPTFTYPYPGSETDMKEPPSISMDELNRMKTLTLTPTPPTSQPIRPNRPYHNIRGGGKSPRYKSATTAKNGMLSFTKIKEDIIFKTNKIIKELEEISRISTGKTVGTGRGRMRSNNKLPSVDNIQRFVGLTMDDNGDGLNIQYINKSGQMETRNIDFNNADIMSQLSSILTSFTQEGNTSAPSNLFDEATSGNNSNISLFGGDESEEQLRAQANFHHESAILAQQKIDVIRQTKKTKDMEAAKANPKINLQLARGRRLFY